MGAISEQANLQINKQDCLKDISSDFEPANYTSAAFADNQNPLSLQLTNTEPQFPCINCKQYFYNLKQLISHTCHSINYLYQCDRCYKTFTRKCYLLRHLHIHERVNYAYQCNQCDRSFEYSSRLVDHIRIHTGEKPFACQHCFASFRLKSGLNRHLLIHIVEKPYKCQYCARTFIRPYKLRDHMTVHTGETPYGCAHCGKYFRLRSSLLFHLKIHSRVNHNGSHWCDKTVDTCRVVRHNGAKEYRCRHCSLSFRCRYHWYVHTADHIPKSHQCEYCLNWYKSKAALMLHTRAHTDEKPYRCDRCDKSYKYAGSLHKHIRTHIGVKSYKCDDVDESFQESGIVKCHTVDLTDDKPFRCEHCDRSFKLRCHLANHSRTHTLSVEDYRKKYMDVSISEFRCLYCKIKLSSKIELLQHMRKYRKKLMY